MVLKLHQRGEMTSLENALRIARLRFRMTQSEEDARLCERLYKELQDLKEPYVAPARGFTFYMDKNDTRY